MPTIPEIQTLTNQNVRQELADGGFARQNLFQVFIDNGWGKNYSGAFTPFLEYLKTYNLKPNYGFDWNSAFKRKLSFSCAEATIPTSSYATGEVKNNYMGIPQEFAHTRIVPDIDFSFYIDRNYTVLTFFEAWLDYVAGGNEDMSQYDEPATSYTRRLNYPKHYKNATGFFITKFERNYRTNGATNITYQLINAFPKNVSVSQLAYGEADVMKVTVTMNYDRYRIYRNYAIVNDEVSILPVL